MNEAPAEDGNGGCKRLLRHDCGARAQLPHVANKSALVAGLPLSCGSRWKSDGDRKALLFTGSCQGCSPFNVCNVAKLFALLSPLWRLREAYMSSDVPLFVNLQCGTFSIHPSPWSSFPSFLHNRLFRAKTPWRLDPFLQFLWCHVRGILYHGRIKDKCLLY